MSATELRRPSPRRLRASGTVADVRSLRSQIGSTLPEHMFDQEVLP